MASDQIRTYDRGQSVVFLKTNEPFGGLSNMAGGFPLEVNGCRIRTSEALYQACRFPHLADVQRLIVRQISPMTAKMKSKPYRRDSRPDWNIVRVKIMRWCLRVKLAQNWSKFSELLLATGNRSIVEESRKDDFWGAKAMDHCTLVGRNVLGRLLMELREEVKAGPRDLLLHVEPPPLPDFLFDRRPIQAVDSSELERRASTPFAAQRGESAPSWSAQSPQAGLFNLPAALESAVSNTRSGRPQGRVTGDLKPYPAMKDSGLSWLGVIPASWGVVRNGRLFMERKETGFAGLPLLEVSLRSGVRVRRFDDDARKQLMSDRDKYKRACARDLAYNMMRMWQGAVGLVPVDGLVSPAYVVARPLPGVVARYFAYLFRTDSYMGEVDQWSHGIVKDRNRLYWDQFKQMSSVCPPTDEQAAIVRFLDHVDRQIRRYIRAKEKLIKVLEEQQQAIIHRAISRGLDPNVRLKPSGVEGLGDIPEHWTVKRFKFLARATSGQVDPRTAEHRTKILVAPNHIESGAGRVVFEETAEKQGADSGKYLVHRGQVIYSKIRPNLRKAAIARLDCLCSADMYPLTVRESELRPQFLLQLLLSVPFTRFVVECSLRVAMPKVNREALGAGWLWYPDLREQDAILEQMQVSAAPFEAAIGQSKREIALILEFRARLIADAVTGKLDVREAAAMLPDDAEEAELFDYTPASDTDEAPENAEPDAVLGEDEA